MSDYCATRTQSPFEMALMQEQTEKETRILDRAGYSLNEVRSIWRRSYKDREAFLMMLDILATRDKVSVANMLDVDLMSLMPRGKYDVVKGIA